VESKASSLAWGIVDRREAPASLAVQKAEDLMRRWGRWHLAETRPEIGTKLLQC